MDAYFGIIVACVLVAAWAGTAPIRASVAVALVLALSALSAALISILLGELLELRMFTAYFASVGIPSLLSLAAARILHRKGRALRFAGGALVGGLAMQGSTYVALVVSCLWGVCL